MSTASLPLVERKKFDNKKAHQITANIWWVGFVDENSGVSNNPYLLVDDDEGVLINPGSGAERHYRLVHDKVSTIIDPAQISHIVVGHHDPARCAALPRFETAANRNVRIYAPSAAVEAVACYGPKTPVIGLDGGDSIILKSGRTIDFFVTPNLPLAGSGLLYDNRTGTVFAGNIFGCPGDDWNLFASPDAWESLTPCIDEGWGSKKAVLHALNKLERLSPERICPQRGPIIEDNINKYIEAARRFNTDK